MFDSLSQYYRSGCSKQTFSSLLLNGTASGVELICFEQKDNIQMKKATEYPKPSLEERLAKGQPQRTYPRHYDINKNRNEQQKNQYGYRKHNSPDYNKYRTGPKELPRIRNNQPAEEKESARPSRREDEEGRRRGKELNKNPSTSALNDQKIQEQTQDYKKLSQKLNLIESKIADMKRHVQKKREEKQLLIEAKRQRERQREEERRASEQKDPHSHTADLKQFVSSMPEHSQLHTFQKNPYSPKHSIYYISEIVKSYRDDKSLARQHLLTSLHIFRTLQNSKFATDQEMRNRQVRLSRKPEYEGKKVVVFDLDETLIHCNDTLTPPYDIKLPITFPTGEVIEAGINIRPHAQDILKNLSKHFEVIVFTASHSCYANVVLDYLDPNSQYIQHRLFRQHCYQTPEGMYAKDLRVINRDLCDMVLVDNAAYSYAAQPENGIPILPYYHGRTDFELKALEKYLLGLVLVKDVRQYNRKTFQFHLYRNYYSNPQLLVEELYMQQES